MPILPRHLKVIFDQIVKTVDKAAGRQADNTNRINEQQVAVGNDVRRFADDIKRLADQLERYIAAQNAAEPGKRGRENKTILALIAAAVFTAALAGLAGCQLHEMIKVYDPIKDQAAAVRDAIAISQRPIIYFLPLAFYTRSDQVVRYFGIRLDIGNSGNLPTKDFSYKVNCLPTTTTIADPFNDRRFIEQDSVKANLGPKVVIPPIACDYSADDMTGIARGLIYVVGKATYRDRFDDSKIRQTEYCFRVDHISFQPQPGIIGGSSTPCEGGA